MVAAGLAGVGWQWRQAVDARDAAEASAISAEANAVAEARAKAEAVAARDEAVATTRVAESRLSDFRTSGTAQLIQAGDMQLARRELLSAAERGWEWHHLHRLAHPVLWRETLTQGAEYWPQVLAVSPDGRLPAVTCGDPYRDNYRWDTDQPSYLEVRDRRTGKLVLAPRRVLPLKTRQVVWLDADRVAAVDHYGGLTVTDLRTGRPTAQSWPASPVFGPTDRTPVARLSPDGRWLVRGSGRGEITPYDVPAGRVVTSMTVQPGMLVAPLDVLPSGRTAVRVGPLGGPAALVVVDLPACEVRSRIEGVGRLAVLSPDGRRVAATRCYAGVGGPGVWDVADGSPVWGQRFEADPDEHRQLDARDRHDEDLLFTPDGRSLLEKRFAWRRVRVWDAATGAVRFELGEHANRVTAIAVGPDGRTVATGAGDGSARLWSLTEGNQLATLSGHPAGPRALAYDPAVSRLVTGGMSNTVACWDLTRGGGQGGAMPHLAPPESHGYTGPSEFGGLWATADGAGWRLDTFRGELTRFDPVGFVPVRQVALDGLTKRARYQFADFALSPDGRRLLGPATSTRPAMWDTATGGQVGPLPPLPAMSVLAAGFSPDGRGHRLADRAGWQGRVPAAGVGHGHRGGTVPVGRRAGRVPQLSVPAGRPASPRRAVVADRAGGAGAARSSHRPHGAAAGERSDQTHHACRVGLRTACAGRRPNSHR